MASITLRSSLSRGLTNSEVDDNFTNLNNDKAENGANSDITSMSGVTGEIGDPTQIQFDPQSGHPAYSEGLLWYDTIHNTLNYYGDESGLVHEIGLEEHQKVYNNSGVTIAKGEPLYFSGNFNGYPTAARANATDVNKYNAQGIAAHSIENGTYGYVCTAGLVEGVDTSGLNSGNNFFVGLTDGAVQNSSPTYPNFPMCLGWVVNSDATNGILLVNQQNHSVNSFRVRTDTHIGGDLIIDGNLTVVGEQTSVGQTNVTQGAPFLRLNEGNAIGESGTTFTGSGLDDAFFSGHFTGTAAQTYYVRIDSVGGGTGGVDTFEVAVGTDSTFQNPILTGVDITGDPQLIHSTDNISVEFGSTTGHTLDDSWSGTASPIDADTGIWTNRNTGATGVGYTHMGIYFDVSDSKFRLVDEYDPVPTGTINTLDNSYSAGTLIVDGLEATSATVGGNDVLTTASSNINADTVDGLQASQFLRSDANDTMSGKLGIVSTGTIGLNPDYSNIKSKAFAYVDDGTNVLGFDGNEITGSSEVYITSGTNSIVLNSDAKFGSGGTIFNNTSVGNWNTAYGYGSKLDGIESGATADQTADEIRSLVESATDSNVFTDADHSKLDGIESGATADQTASEILTAIKTVDGTGSELDADTLDGIQGSSYLRSDADDTYSGSHLNFDSGKRLSGGSGSFDGFFMPQNPEGKHIRSPYFFNDQAYARLRGATVSVDVDGTPMTSASAIDNMLNANGDYWNMTTAGVTTVTIEITNLPKSMNYSQHMGVTFGNPNWRAKDITMEAFYGGQWNSIASYANQGEEFVINYFNPENQVTTRLRWTFENFNSTSMRIVSLFAYSFDSSGMEGLYVTRDGGSIYDSIDVAGDITVTGTVDTTNLEVTNLKAKDGTASATIADGTGDINFTGNLTKDNNTVWHNGNKTFYVATNTNNVAGAWKASIPDITAYIDGQVIVFYPNKINGASPTTFEINSLGVKNIKAPGSATSNLTTHYHGSNLILLRYNAGDDCFNVHADYDTTDDYRIRWAHGVTGSNSSGSGTAIHGYQLLMEGIDGKFYPVTEGGSTANTNPVSTAEFRVGGTIISYESGTDIAVNGTVGSYNLYESIQSGVMEYWNNRDSGWAIAYRPVYLVATMNANGNFVLDNTSFTSFLTQDLPTSDDGKYYIDIGLMINTYDNYRLEVTHPIYVYKDNMVREWGGYANNADKLDDQTGSYYLDYSNFSNTPSNATTSVSGLMAREDKTKLDGIESGATADQSASEILTAIKTVDGSGSGLDADTVDGIEASSFLRSDATDTATGALTFGNILTLDGSQTGGYPLMRLTSGSTSTSRIHFGTTADVDEGIIEYDPTQNHLDFTVGAVNRFRMEADGDFHADGDVIAYSTTISDRRLKTDIKNIDDAVEKVKQLNGCTFKRHDGQASAGVIAQDVEAVLPEAIREKKLPLHLANDHTTYKLVEYDAIIGLLVESVKELTARVEELENAASDNR